MFGSHPILYLVILLELFTLNTRFKSFFFACDRDHLIYKRNRRMGARVIELLVNNPGTSYFFAFGAGHFVGENTVLDVVRNAGLE